MYLALEALSQLIGCLGGSSRFGAAAAANCQVWYWRQQLHIHDSTVKLAPVFRFVWWHQQDVPFWQESPLIWCPVSECGGGHRKGATFSSASGSGGRRAGAEGSVGGALGGAGRGWSNVLRRRWFGRWRFIRRRRRMRSPVVDPLSFVTGTNSLPSQKEQPPWQQVENWVCCCCT